jgi:hypothetical protein
MAFLINHCPNEKCDRLIELAERAGVLRKAGFKYYEPGTLNEAELT